MALLFTFFPGLAILIASSILKFTEKQSKYLPSYTVQPNGQCSGAFSEFTPIESSNPRTICALESGS